MKNNIKNYTNSVQHNVLATVIDNLNDKKSLSFIEKSKIGTNECRVIKDTGFIVSTLHAMSEILEEIHALGYKIVKR